MGCQSGDEAFSAVDGDEDFTELLIRAGIPSAPLFSRSFTMTKRLRMFSNSTTPGLIENFAAAASRPRRSSRRTRRTRNSTARAPVCAGTDPDVGPIAKLWRRQPRACQQRRPAPIRVEFALSSLRSTRNGSIYARQLRPRSPSRKRSLPRPKAGANDDNVLRDAYRRPEPSPGSLIMRACHQQPHAKSFPTLDVRPSRDAQQIIRYTPARKPLRQRPAAKPRRTCAFQPSSFLPYYKGVLMNLDDMPRSIISEPQQAKGPGQAGQDRC